ncbi:MAG: hypothetical protein ACRDPH_14215 [Marmoricola sp.]
MKTRPPRPRRVVGRLLAAASLLLLVPLLAACGFNAQTDALYQAAAGTNNRSQPVYVLNSVVVTSKNGSGTWAGSLVNTNQRRADALVGMTGWSGGSQIRVGAGQLVNLGKSGKVTLKGAKIKPGAFIPLTLHFASGQTTHLLTPVLPYGPHGQYSAVPQPSQQPTPKTGSHHKGGHGSKSSPSPSAG